MPFPRYLTSYRNVTAMLATSFFAYDLSAQFRRYREIDDLRCQNSFKAEKIRRLEEQLKGKAESCLSSPGP